MWTVGHCVNAMFATRGKHRGRPIGVDNNVAVGCAERLLFSSRVSSFDPVCGVVWFWLFRMESRYHRKASDLGLDKALDKCLHWSSPVVCLG
jgi:hypothetical protein